MFLLDWYRDWVIIRRQVSQGSREDKICESCETLRHQLEIANFEKKQLLDRILITPPSVSERTIAPTPESVKPRTIPWRVRQQMLEAEDRAKAAAQRHAAQEDKKPIVDVSDMERELDIAAEQRESAGNK